MFLRDQAAEILPVATLRDGRVEAEYRVYERDDLPNRFHIRRGRRYLIEIFDDDASVPAELSARLATAAEGGAGASAPLDLMERFLGFFFGRSVARAGEPVDIASRARSVSAAGLRARRRAAWRVMRLAGWRAPKVLLMVRSTGGGRTPAGANSRIVYHSFPLSLADTDKLRQGLDHLRSQPAFPAPSS